MIELRPQAGLIWEPVRNLLTETPSGSLACKVKGTSKFRAETLGKKIVPIRIQRGPFH